MAGSKTPTVGVESFTDRAANVINGDGVFSAGVAFGRLMQIAQIIGRHCTTEQLTHAIGEHATNQGLVYLITCFPEDFVQHGRALLALAQQSRRDVAYLYEPSKNDRPDRDRSYATVDEATLITQLNNPAFRLRERQATAVLILLRLNLSYELFQACLQLLDPAQSPDIPDPDGQVDPED